MKPILLLAAAALLLAATPAMAKPPGTVEVRIRGNVAIADGTAPKRTWSNRKTTSARSAAPVTICFAPPNGNDLRGSFPRRAPRRSTCKQSKAGRL